jgi:hypothetical protein
MTHVVTTRTFIVPDPLPRIGHSETPGTPDHILLAEIERRGLESQNLRHRARRERERWEFGQLEQEIEKDAREQRQLERLERERWVNEISEHRERDRDLEELRRQFEETKLQAQMERDPQNKNILRGQESKEKERSQPIPIPSRGKNARAYYSPSLSDVSERETEYSKRGSSSRPAKISRRCDSCDGIDHGKMSEKKRGKGKV